MPATSHWEREQEREKESEQALVDEFCRGAVIIYAMHTTGVQCQGAQTISWPRYVRWWMYAFAIWICLYVVYAPSVPTTISQSRSNGKSFIKYSIILSLRMSGQRMSTLFSRYVCERVCVCVCVVFSSQPPPASSLNATAIFAMHFRKTTTRISIQRDICTHYLV